MEIKKILSLALIQFLSILSPGPDFILILRATTLYNIRYSFFVMLGIVSAAITHIFINVVGIVYVIKKNLLLLNIVTLCGGLYIFYLGIKILLNRKQTKLNNNLKKNSSQKILYKTAFISGFLTSLLNPKAMLFFFGIFVNFLNFNNSYKLNYFYILEIVFIDFLAFSTLILIFSRKNIKNKFLKNIDMLDKITGIILILISLSFLYTQIIKKFNF